MTIYDILKDSAYKTVQFRVRIDYNKFFALCTSDKVRSLDLYCNVCKMNKTFVRQSINASSLLGTFGYPNKGAGTSYSDAIRLISYSCPTCGSHSFYAFYYDGDYIYKLAQFPSLLDVSRNELKEFNKNALIDEDSYKEIYKAYECASSGFYVAAYTYLRRVYENLFFNLFKKNQSEFTISLDDFIKLKFDNKLELLKGILVIEDAVYKPLYSLLSSGIHSLSEDECQNYYYLLKNILLEILMEQKTKEERKSNHKAILDIYSKIKATDKSVGAQV